MLQCQIQPHVLRSDLENHFHTQGESFTSVLCGDADKFSGPELISDGLEESGNVCCGQMNPCFSLFWGETVIEFSVPKTKWTNQTFASDSCKSKHLSWY